MGECLFRLFSQDGGMENKIVEVESEDEILKTVKDILLGFHDVKKEDLTEENLEKDEEYIFWGNREIYIYKLDEWLDYQTLKL